jgi:ATP-dependent protease HslVU (ClpYQ) peptidase subunit
MTVCAAFKERGRVYLGADSGVSDDTLIQANADPKIVRSQNFSAAIAGDLRVRDLLEVFDAPESPIRGLRRFVISEWIPAFQNMLKGNGQDLAAHETDLILVVRRRIFLIGSDFDVSEPGIVVIGTGGPVALGVLRALRGNGAPAARMRTAILEACAADMYCRPPARVAVL